MFVHWLHDPAGSGGGATPELDAASAALPMTAGLLTGASADDEDAMVLWPLSLLTAQRTQLPPCSAAGGRVSALGPAHISKVRAKL